MGTHYVSPTGSASNAGTLEAPWNLLKGATSTAAGDVTYVLPGIYRTSRKYDSWAGGASGNPAVLLGITGSDGKRPSIRATEVLTGWTADTGGVYTAVMPWSMVLGTKTTQGTYDFTAGKDGRDLLWVDGDPLEPARWPKLPSGSTIYTQDRVAHWKRSVGYSLVSSTSIGGGRWLNRGIYTVDALPAISDWSKVCITFAPAYRWITQGGRCVSATANTLTFEWISTADMTTNQWYCASSGDYFFLWGSRELLTQPGEFVVDVPSMTAYVRLLDSSDPVGHVVEALTDDNVFQFWHKPWVTLQNLDFVGGRIFAQGTCDGVSLLNCTVDLPDFRMRPEQGQYYVSGNAGIDLGGSFHAVRHCFVKRSPSNAVSLTGVNCVVEDCIVDCYGFAGLGHGVDLYGANSAVIGNTFLSGGTSVAIAIRGAGQRVLKNLIDGCSKLTGDNGAIFIVRRTSGANGAYPVSEVAYNTVRNIHTESGPNYYNTSGIYLEGETPEGNSYYDIHHNLAPSIAIQHGIGKPQTYIRCYNNTFFSGIFIPSGSSGAGAVVTGTEFRNSVYTKSDFPNRSPGIAWSNNYRLGTSDKFTDAVATLDPTTAFQDAAHEDYRPVPGGALDTAACGALTSTGSRYPHLRA